jgi:hypothetical protein
MRNKPEFHPLELVQCPRNNWTGPFHGFGGADDRFSSSVGEGLRPAEFHEKP